MTKKLRLLMLFFLLVTLKSQAQSVAFSVQAHEDDWQLFMPTQVVADLSISNRKMVFITLTAGDGSAGAAAYGPSSVPFYLTRENGSVYSAKHVADLTTGTTPLDVPLATVVSISGHNITKYTYKNTVNYFFRLPDGDGDGSGFPNTGQVSLQKLKQGTISSISALGPTPATYTWAQLTATIKQIITNEKVTGTQSYIHAAHTLDGSNSAYNPGDHSDHRYASLAAQEAVSSGMSWVGVNGFMDYHSSSFSSPVLSATDHENASALFGLTNWGLIEEGYATNFNTQHKGWLPIDFFQLIKLPSGNAPFAGTGNGEPEKTDIASLTEMPMIVSITSPVFVDKDLSMIISPYEAGQLTTTVYDMAGNKLSDLTTTVKNREPLFVTLKQGIKQKGSYLIKNILNDKYIQTRKIIVE